MAFPGIFRQLFENDGAGPKLRKDILPQDDTATYENTLTASGNWTAPYDGYYLVKNQGGGGGSGGAAGGSNNWVATSGGNSGQSVSFVRHYYKGQVIPYVIGAGGTYGAATATSVEAGGKGGDTTFDGVVATGGSGSNGMYLAGSSNTKYPRSEPTPQIGVNTGNPAKFGYFTAGDFKDIQSGSGASSPFGAGGDNVTATTTVNAAPGLNGAGYGAGAGGAAVYGAYARGANGSQGCVRITFLGV